uniref:Uncharacterized protein n=1 Tax=Rhizophora mucronata TaxID=61149 RepID=A0A2P2KTY7_RHIMU
MMRANCLCTQNSLKDLEGTITRMSAELNSVASMSVVDSMACLLKTLL